MRGMEGDAVGSIDNKSPSPSSATIAVRASAAAEGPRLIAADTARSTSAEKRQPPPAPSGTPTTSSAGGEPTTDGGVFAKPDPLESKRAQSSCLPSTPIEFSPSVPARPIWPIWRVHANDLLGRHPAHTSLQTLGQLSPQLPPDRPASCVDALAAAGSPAKVLDAVRASARLAQHKKWVRNAVSGLRSRQRRCQHQLERLKRLRALRTASHPLRADTPHRAGRSHLLRDSVHIRTDTGEHLDAVSRLLEEMQVEVKTACVH